MCLACEKTDPECTWHTESVENHGIAYAQFGLIMGNLYAASRTAVAAATS